MMGAATLDGQSLYATYGALLAEDTIGALLRYPTRETVRQTAFAEVHGIQADLRHFRVQRRRVTLSFMLLADGEGGLKARREALASELKQGGWHTLDAGLGISHRLRFVAMPSFLIHRPVAEGLTGASLTVTMEEEAFPAQADALPVPPAFGVPRGIASIDGVDFAQFGASLDADFAGATCAAPEVKDPFDDGRMCYVTGAPTRNKAADWVLYVDLVAPDCSTFVSNWAALYAAFAKPDLHRLQLREQGERILMPAPDVFYRDCTACTATVGTNGFGLKMQIKVTAPVVY